MSVQLFTLPSEEVHSILYDLSVSEGIVPAVKNWRDRQQVKFSLKVCKAVITGVRDEVALLGQVSAGVLFVNDEGTFEFRLTGWR
jgi:hypothetical protein